MIDRKSVSNKMRFEVLKRDNFTCQYCGASAPDVILEVDHIIPRYRGGKHEMSNLKTSCINCNRGKGRRGLDEPFLGYCKTEISEQKLRNNEPLMTTDETAAELCITRESLYGLINSGEIKVIRLGRIIRINREEVDRIKRGE